MLAPPLPQVVYKCQFNGVEPKETSLVDEFRNKIDGSINTLLYGHYKNANGDEIPLLFGQDRYARAGLVQHAVEQRYNVRCRLVRRAIDDIKVATKDLQFVASRGEGEYVFARVARETVQRMQKLVEGHGPHCPQSCTVRM